MEALKIGEPVEVLISNNDGGLGFENASFVGYDEDKAVVRFHNGKHKQVPLTLVKARGKPWTSKTCYTCGSKGKWVDHGPAVGKGWYCTKCKEDIPSNENTYGISGKKIVASKVPDLFSKTEDFEVINCGKTISCTSCKGMFMNRKRVDVKVGDEVLCDYATGSPSLQANKMYKVHEVNEDSFGIDINGSVKKFSRCRFLRKIPK